MKLILENELNEYFENPDLVDEYLKLMEDFSIYGDCKVEDNLGHISIPAQKIVLDEIDMNHLFADIFSEFPHTLRYSWLGSAGCDFSMALQWIVDNR